MGLRTATMLTGLVIQLLAHRLRAVTAGAGVLLVALILGITGIGTLGTAIALQEEPAQPTPVATRPAPSEPTLTPATDTGPKPMDHSVPSHLAIPAIGVDTPLMQVGLNPDGSLETPKGDQYDLAAWYDGSPTPGQPGASIIEGHIDHYLDGASVFYRLGELAGGERIEVTREDGSRAAFEVTNVQSYAKNEFPTAEVYTTPGDEPELRLITCGGEFDSAAGDYTRNTVVYARLLAK